jgi:DnaA-homolog protein
MVTQLALDLQLRESYTFENFVVGSNALAIELLKQISLLQGEQQLFFWGGNCCGKSHLLQAVCQLANQQNFTATYLPLKQFINYSPEVFEDLESINLVCIDDVQEIEDRSEWQEKCFDLINRMRTTDNKLLFTASLPPNELNLQLEDLRSRLNWGPVMQIEYLDDAEKQKALQLRASMKGFELPQQVASYMLKNYSRDMPALYEKLEQLDQASLQQQRRLTVPFVKAVFE